MIQIVRANQRHFSDLGWLQTYWLFSFSGYYDPQNIQFGALRVFNDDVVSPGMGFPTHPHREMEIITIPLSGELTHEDSVGNRMIIKAGDVQRMSAGTGLTHSEFNLGDTPCHFYQIWIFPDTEGLKPIYDQESFSPRDWHNKLLPVASGQGLSNAVTFHTDATIYRADLDPGQVINLPTNDSRRIFIYVTEGNLQADHVRLDREDQARIEPEGDLTLQAHASTSLIVIDVPSCRGWGYDRATLRGSRK
jgi:quercetin 2,3-dioxygenase